MLVVEVFDKDKAVVEADGRINFLLREVLLESRVMPARPAASQLLKNIK